MSLWPMEIHTVNATGSPEFRLLRWCLRHSLIVALDAEWKPSRRCTADDPDAPRRFPTVSLLQIACRVDLRRLQDDSGDAPESVGESPVFLVDLLAVPLDEIWEALMEMFVSPSVLKLGFRFKQDLIYLSSTFCAQGCCLGFESVEPFLDIIEIYNHLRNQNGGKKHPKETKSLSTICEELLGVSLSKDLQCSDWSCRPLSKEQKLYAAADAYCLLEIFDIFMQHVCSKELIMGMKKAKASVYDCLPTTNLSEESDTRSSSDTTFISANSTSISSNQYNIVHDGLLYISREYSDKILLKESEKTPRPSRRKVKKASTDAKCKEQLLFNGDWQGTPPWDVSLGGDGFPKFLCDVMVEGLAKHLRCVGFDAATPMSKKPDPRILLDQAYREKRVVLTRDVKLLKHQYFTNQVYRVKSLLKNDQLLEVIETFQLEISEEQLMSRCTKCNGSFIQKPLSTKEAIAASKGFQIIPNCLFNRDLEFWQCTDCRQIYWEGTQYQNAVQKFVSICKLND